MPGNPEYIIFPLGDAALTIDFGNIINESTNAKVLSLFQKIAINPVAGMIEAVPSYSSLTVYYNVFELSKRVNSGTPVFDYMCEQLTNFLNDDTGETGIASSLVTIPVCYEKEYSPDIDYIARKKNISTDELVNIHVSKQYRVYMLGFLPGFSYMGEVEEKISISRKSQPVTVPAGSVGIAGKQTGIYPMTCPGGWQIIGRTPLTLFDPKKEEPALLKAGDRVQFISISKNEFENY